MCINSPDFFHDRFFKLHECYEPVVSHCKGELVFASRVFKSRQRYICGDRFTRKGNDPIKSCVQMWQKNIGKCWNHYEEKKENHPRISESSVWCSLTKDYITCIYSVFALGCTLETADEYMATVNQSKVVVEAVYGHGCDFGHPLDILKTTTPVSLTSPHQDGEGADYNSGHHPSLGSSRSVASSFHALRAATAAAAAASTTKGFSPSSLLHWLIMFLWDLGCSAAETVIVPCCLLSLLTQPFLTRSFYSQTCMKQKSTSPIVRKTARQR
ncbi:hypothetical protein PoB_004507800 [Plakobranchus ocellatus]|uniref:Uncharacterized protein n=1 Tax=Plakobranchus ocellatus TaxID=259542 RepID=A0AAV4BHD7_9GAST|nr:hypothetical protein PoB_004507800 [Plakobranchus ocellatus]